MSYFPAVIALLIGLIIIAYVVWPLLSANAESLVTDGDEALELIQRKDMVLRNIKELEFDQQTGKLSEEDFSRLNYQLRQQAVALLKRIESSTPEMVELEQEIESAIAEVRK